MSLALVVLAAGASRRLGEPKALVELGGCSVLERLLAAGAGCRAAAALVVGGAHQAELAAALPAGAELVHNQDWEAGRSGSLQLAVRQRPELDLCVAPADVPLVPGEVFDALEAEWQRAGAPAHGWLAPAHGGERSRPGHPIVIGRALAARVLELAPDDPLRKLRNSAQPLWKLDLDCAAILDDLDTPEDLARLRARFDLC